MCIRSPRRGGGCDGDEGVYGMRENIKRTKFTRSDKQTQTATGFWSYRTRASGDIIALRVFSLLVDKFNIVSDVYHHHHHHRNRHCCRSSYDSETRAEVNFVINTSCVSRKVGDVKLSNAPFPRTFLITPLFSHSTLSEIERAIHKVVINVCVCTYIHIQAARNKNITEKFATLHRFPAFN